MDSDVDAPTPGQVAIPLPREPIIEFLAESLRIEGIHRPPSQMEIDATARFMRLFQMSATALNELQAVYAPGKPLRDREGMDVRVGNYVAPRGGPNIVRALQRVVARANGSEHPYKTHVAFEMLHPYLDGNGRTGRALWAWQMQGCGYNPFGLPFLHRFYYQTLEHSR